MKVIVIGGSGFLGSHTADILTENGYDVTLFDNVPSKYIKSSQRMIIGDILNRNQVETAIDGMDIVYNFAAKADIDNKSSVDVMESNIIGSINILDACVKHKVKRYIFASSIYVYSNMGSFYRISKQTCESLIEEYNKLYGLSYTILRYGSLYGPRANCHNWIKTAIKQAIHDKKIIRHGDGNEIREYIHVRDAAELSMNVIDKPFENKTYILTGNQSMKINDIHMMIKEILDKDIQLEYTNTPSETHYTITPYAFSPKVAKKLTKNEYYDIGQGILECIIEEYENKSN